MAPLVVMQEDRRSVPLPRGVRLESTSCPLGWPPSDVAFARGRDRIHHLPGEFRVVRCTRCGLARTDPRPTADTIGFYYPDDYEPYRYTRGAVPGPRKRVPKPLWRRIARRLVEFNSDRLPPCEKGHVLELGCASGAYLEHLAGLGFSVEGVEPNATAATFARSRGFRVQATTIEKMESPERPPSLIVGWMVLEHLHEPIACLRNLHGWAADGAQLAISVPTAVRRMSIGLMPLPDTELTRGKCSFKMLQYMASGLPVAVSPVGSNAEILALGDLGYACDGPGAWEHALTSSYRDRDRARRMGAVGRAVVEREFSVTASTAKLARIFRSL